MWAICHPQRNRSTFWAFYSYTWTVSLKFACSSRSSFKPFRSWRPVSRSWDEVSLWLNRTCSSRPYSELPQFRKPTTWHQMDGKTRNTLLFFLKIYSTLVASCRCGTFLEFQFVSLSARTKHHTVTFLEVRMWSNSVVAKSGGKDTFGKLPVHC